MSLNVQKVVNFFHKAASVVLLASGVASSVPAASGYAALLAQIAVLLAGVGATGSVSNVVKNAVSPASSSDS